MTFDTFSGHINYGLNCDIYTEIDPCNYNQETGFTTLELPKIDMKNTDDKDIFIFCGKQTHDGTFLFTAEAIWHLSQLAKEYIEKNSGWKLCFLGYRYEHEDRVDLKCGSFPGVIEESICILIKDE